MVRWLWLMLCALAWALPVRADSFVIAPPWYQPAGTDAEALSDKIAELIEAQLKSQYIVLSPWKVVSKVPPKYRVACFDGECAKQFQDAADHATAALLVRTFRDIEGKGPSTSFQIALQPEVGLVYFHSAKFSEGPLDELVRKVLGDLFRDYRRGPGPFLYVKGGPEGATVYVDEKAVGRLPVRLPLSVGHHRIRVEADGFATITENVVLELGRTREVDVHLEPARKLAEPTLESTSPSAPPPLVPRERSERQRWTAVGLMAGGGAVLGLGALYLGYAIHGYRQAGCGEPGCEAIQEFQGKVGVSAGLASAAMALGAVSLGTGIGLFLRDKRMRVSSTMGPNQALLILKGEL